MNQMTPDKATRALESIPASDLDAYHSYFNSIKPATDEDIFRAGLFAHASVHVSWQRNVRLFSLLRDLEWLGSRRWLRGLVEESGAGLTNNRTEYIWKFAKDYWANPGAYLKAPGEMWCQYRDRLQGLTLGLGHAKTSFFLELTSFQASECICIDTHVLQMYGLPGNQSPGLKTMDYIERHWVSTCARLGIPPVTARWYIWDRKQKRTDSRYWSYVIEPKNAIPVPRQLKLFEMVA